MLARSSNQGVNFAVERVDGAATGNNVGTFSALDIHTDDTIGISYLDTTNNNLKFAKKSATGLGEDPQSMDLREVVQLELQQVLIQGSSGLQVGSPSLFTNQL